MRSRSYATVKVILKVDVVFEHDEDESDIVLENRAQLFALNKLGNPSEDDIEDVEIVALDWAHDNDPVTKIFDYYAAQEYLEAAFLMQDLLADNNSGVRINGQTSDPAALDQIVSISQRMWRARKQIEAALPRFSTE